MFLNKWIYPLVLCKFTIFPYYYAVCNGRAVAYYLNIKQFKYVWLLRNFLIILCSSRFQSATRGDGLEPSPTFSTTRNCRGGFQTHPTHTGKLFLFILQIECNSPGRLRNNRYFYKDHLNKGLQPNAIDLRRFFGH